jgi:hypothetical protein
VAVSFSTSSNASEAASAAPPSIKPKVSTPARSPEL